MTLRPCPNEAEIRQLLERGHWPHSASPELCAHASECRACGDLVLITQAFRMARAASLPLAPLQSPGVLWWRAQLRRRNAAVERMNWPILGAQIFALATTLVIAVTFAVSQARHGANWLSWLASVAKSPSFDRPDFHWRVLWPFATGWLKPEADLLYMIPGLAMLVLLGGVVVYLASEKQ